MSAFSIILFSRFKFIFVQLRPYNSFFIFKSTFTSIIVLIFSSLSVSLFEDLCNEIILFQGFNYASNIYSSDLFNLVLFLIFKNLILLI